MLRILVIAATLVLGTGVAVFFVLTEPTRVPAAALGPHTPDLANGRTMFFAGGCASCHASSKEDRTRLGGGAPLHSPFGTFHAPNISPDPNDGIGRWSEAAFVTAMQDGTSPDGSHYYPAFPYTSYQRMETADIRDLFAFLKTLPPVQGRAPDHEMAFPFSVRRGIGLWKTLHLDGLSFRPDPTKSAAWNRGAYLVNGPGHCAECHSPRNALGGVVASQRFAGGPNPEGEGFVPNITGKGLASWSAKDIAYMLETGDLPDGDSVGGTMAAVVRNTRELSAQDRDAMAEYLKSLPPVDGPPKPERK
ncbi:c-type cytochrome [Rhodoplanes roseus]|uniref:Alkylated DNA repair protein n=1 Tax=Rhodoplanes roseus TaxID=29409 RepID=A0A327L2I0_9BRAD|nr:cytochrome c [Rhodoplanes roseus]RAI43692.1 alkylated DNA repair protein [Rhodoplanes roseus]